MADITLPALGESVTEGTITRWLKQVGDTVEVDEPLVEISTDKVDTEVPSPIAGTITEILADEDDTVDVGAVIARVGDAGDAPADDAPAEEPAAEESAPDAEEGTTSEAETEEPEAPSTEAEEPAAAPTAGASDAGGDATDITLPALGESVTEGTITRWLKQVGDTVEVDEPLVEISTDKVDTEVPSPVAGTISEILANEDDTVDVGAVIARVGGSAGGSAPAEAPAQEAPADEPKQEEPKAEEPKAEEPKQEAKPAEAPAPVQEVPPAPKAPEAPAAPKQEAPAAPAAPAAAPAAPAAPAASSGASAYVTPIVRKLAHEQGVDLGSVQGTGVGGRIRKEDVLAAAKAAPAATSAPAAAAAPAPIEDSPLRGTTAKMSRLRKVVAKRAVESMQTTAQLTTVVEVDVTKVAQLRDRVKGRFQETTGQKLSFLPFFSLAAVEALRAHPIINATDDGEEITYPAGEHLSMAVDTERGLLTPVIKDAGKLDLRGFAEQIADLASRTRDNKLGPDELAGGTFTLTNTGSRGALFDTPVVFQPQRAILGVGTVVKRPVVVSVDGQDSIAVRSMVYLALSYDHRIIDGADAARYLTQVKQRLEAGDFEGQLGI